MLFDTIFWKRYADEFHLSPQKPGEACLAGMFQVWAILFVAIMGLMAPPTRLIMIALSLLQDRPALEVRDRAGWFVLVAAVSAIIAACMVKRRYWNFRLTPELTLPYLNGVDRGMVAFQVGLLSAAAVGMMGLMYWLFW